MRELERMISIYHTGFIVCLILACVFLAAAAVMFFKFDIRKIIDMKTGRGARKSIQKMEEINAKTGKLRQDMVSHTPAMLRPEDRIAYPKTARDLHAPDLHAMDLHATDLYEKDGSDTTTLLGETGESSALPRRMAETGKPAENKLPGYFTVKKEILWVHTEEVL